MAKLYGVPLLRYFHIAALSLLLSMPCTLNERAYTHTSTPVIRRRDRAVGGAAAAAVYRNANANSRKLSH